MTSPYFVHLQVYLTDGKTVVIRPNLTPTGHLSLGDKKKLLNIIIYERFSLLNRKLF